MEKLNFKWLWILVLAIGIAPMLVSCSDDTDEPSTDYATTISGNYAGVLQSGGNVIDDTYVISIYRITDNVVSVNADFFDEAPKFNVTYANGIYTLKSSSYSNISMSVRGDMLSVSFTNQAGTLTTFDGKK